MIEVRKKYLAAMNGVDLDALAQLYVPDAIRKAPGEPDCVGQAEIKAHFQSWVGVFEQPLIADKLLFLKGQVMVAIWCWKARHVDQFMGVPASGKDVGLIGASIYWTDGQGRIVREHTYADPYTLMIQLGAIEDSGRGIPEFPAECEIIVADEQANDIENLHQLRKYNHLLLNKELEPWLDCMTDDIEWDDQMVPGLAVGKEHSKSDFMMLAEAFPDAKINMTNLWSVGKYVIHQGIFTATHLGPIKGIPASNKVVNVDNMDIVYFENGKIRNGWTFGNTLEMGSQMGLGNYPRGSR